MSRYLKILLLILLPTFYSSGGLSSGTFSPTITYTLPRTREFPPVFRGMYFRTELEYQIRTSRAEQFDFQILKSVNRNARYRFTYSRNLVGDFNAFELTFSYDFYFTRSTSSLQMNRNIPVVTQTFRGSIGYDSQYQSFTADNRQQVGRAAASIRMFVDSDGSGTFESSEEQIHSDAVRVRNTTGRIIQSDSVARLTQLQSYRRYNLEINEGKIRNPVWVPQIKEFSIVTDPNGYKQIDIPFYITGIIDGKVLRRKDEALQPVAGLRLLLRNTTGDFERTIRTFSDGSFYAMEVPPGEYIVRVDSTQLQFLGVVSNPPIRRFQVRPIPEGDFVEGLTFTLTSPQEDTVKTPIESPCPYYVQVGLFSTWEQVLLEEYLAETLFETEFRVIYDSEYDLYGLISQGYSERNSAETITELVRERLYDDAFVAEDCPPMVQAMTYRVQLAQFETKEKAEAYAEACESLTGQPATIKSFQSELFQVVTGAEENWRKAFEAVTEVRQDTLFRQTTLIREPDGFSLRGHQFYLCFGAFRSPQDAERQRRDLARQIPGVSVRTELLPDVNFTLVRTETLGTFEQAQNLKNSYAGSASNTGKILPELLR